MADKRPVLLVVEGNTTLRTSLRRHLDGRMPVRVIEASNGVEAEELTRRWGPAVILVDLGLVDRPGVGVLRDLQSVHPDAALIAMVSHADAEHVAAATESGARACLRKEDLGRLLEPLLWRSLPVGGMRWSDRVTRSRALAQASVTGSVEQVVTTWESSIAPGLQWLDDNGPWRGQPRTRLLYVADLAGMFVLLSTGQRLA